MRTLVCNDCRAKSPSLLSCIHTFPPRVRKSSILSEGTAIPGVIPDPESDDKAFRAPLVEKPMIGMPDSRRLDLPKGYDTGLGTDFVDDDE